MVRIRAGFSPVSPEEERIINALSDVDNHVVIVERGSCSCSRRCGYPRLFLSH